MTPFSRVGPGRIRPRRLRQTAALRALVAETDVRPAQLIMPHFVLPTEHAVEPIPSMPGIWRGSASTTWCAPSNPTASSASVPCCSSARHPTAPRMPPAPARATPPAPCRARSARSGAPSAATSW